MNRFALTKPGSFEEAAGALQDNKRFSLPVIKAGGIDLLDQLKEGLVEPDALIDVKPLARRADQPMITEVAGRIRIKATTTLAEIAASPLLRRSAPALSQSVDDAASPAVRNVATVAGNLLQRPRCWYYRNIKFRCLKKGGYTCYAMEGENRYHAIFHEGPCVIVHPSNLAPALHVLDAQVHLIGGERDSLPIAGLFHMPFEGILTEHNLKPSELVTHITCSPSPTSGFYAIKERLSFDWPVAMAAVALEMERDVIRSARVCAGAVAPVPHPLPEVEQALTGKSVHDDDQIKAACALASKGAEPLEQNGYKVKLLPVAVRRAIMNAARRDQP